MVAEERSSEQINWGNKVTSHRILSLFKDHGVLNLAGISVSEQKFDRCVLSMSSASTRSRFSECKFRSIKGTKCLVGSPVFEKVSFENIVSDETVTLFEALFLECEFSGRMENLNFGMIPNATPFFSKERFDLDLDRLIKAPYGLDICNVHELVECSFFGAQIAEKIRFRSDQGALLHGAGLDAVLGPLMRSTDDLGLATFISTAVGFGSVSRLHFCPIPMACANRLPDYVAQLRDLGVEVTQEPLC